MVRGSFVENGPRVSLTLLDSYGKQYQIDFLVDTGFVGQLKLSPYWVGTLRLPKQGQAKFQLANGTSETYELYRARGIWNETETVLEVVEMVGEPLIGIELLHGSRLLAEIDEGGTVEIDPL
jgi:clan AA aspartic protease